LLLFGGVTQAQKQQNLQQAQQQQIQQQAQQQQIEQQTQQQQNIQWAQQQQLVPFVFNALATTNAALSGQQNFPSGAWF
jgi:hypothetical protein